MLYFHTCSIVHCEWPQRYQKALQMVLSCVRSCITDSVRLKQGYHGNTVCVPFQLFVLRFSIIFVDFLNFFYFCFCFHFVDEQQCRATHHHIAFVSILLMPLCTIMRICACIHEDFLSISFPYCLLITFGDGST